jgi:hypothetical protein
MVGWRINRREKNRGSLRIRVSSSHCSAAQVGGSAGPPAAEDDPDGTPRDEPGQPAIVLGIAEPNVVVGGHLPGGQPGSGSRRRGSARRVKEDQLAPGGRLGGRRAEECHLDVAQCGAAGGEADEQQPIGLPETTSRPGRGRSVGLVHDEPVGPLDSLQPFDQRSVAGIVRGDLGGSRSELSID